MVVPQGLQPAEIEGVSHAGCIAELVDYLGNDSIIVTAGQFAHQLDHFPIRAAAVLTGAVALDKYAGMHPAGPVQ